MRNTPLKGLTVGALLMAGAVGVAACETFGGSKKQARTAQTELLPRANTQWELPPELREVSAIALLPDNLMACVQDEEGIIYLYDLNRKAVKEKISSGELQADSLYFDNTVPTAGQVLNSWPKPAKETWLARYF